MKKIILILFIYFTGAGLNAQTINPNYDKQLADSLGADSFGMKKYYWVILKTGPNKIDDKMVTDSLFRGHMQNINRLAEMGKLVLAGPLEENAKTYRGIFILSVSSLEEANALLESDPVIKSKIMETEIYKWYGTAAMPLILKFHDKLAKQKF